MCQDMLGLVKGAGHSKKDHKKDQKSTESKESKHSSRPPHHEEQLSCRRTEGRGDRYESNQHEGCLEFRSSESAPGASVNDRCFEIVIGRIHQAGACHLGSRNLTPMEAERCWGDAGQMLGVA